MTRRTPAKPVDPALAGGRLDAARSHLAGARLLIGHAGRTGAGEVAGPAMSLMVLSAIAFTDALTARFGGRINQQDHAAAVALLRDVLGNRLPRGQETRLRVILKEKDSIHYGSRLQPASDALKLADQVEAFAAWAEAELLKPP